ncbi:MAG: TonB family protein [Crocinitomix sp.]|nr:TonB family protein [Crocinitomix sp.]
MKILFIALFGLFLINPVASFAKKDTTIFYCNKELKKVKKKYGYYYAKVYLQKDGTYGVQQFSEDGTLIMKGAYADKKLKTKQGQFVYFRVLGTPQITGSYDRNLKSGIWNYISDKGIVTAVGKYLDNKRTGEWRFFNKEGAKKSISNYIDGDYEGTYLEWQDDTLVTEGQYKKDKKVGYWQGWFSDGSKDYHGNYINGLRDGEWKFYFGSNKISAIEQYKNGEATKAEWFDKEGNSITPKDPLEQEPSFPGGPDAMNEFTRNNINYPEYAREMGEQGIIYVAFNIDGDGTLTDIRIRKGVSDSLDKECLRLVRTMPKWIPGIDHGRNSNVDFTVPFHFRLG